MFQLPESIAQIAQSGDHLMGEDRAPHPYKPETQAGFRKTIVEQISKLDLAQVSSLTGNGWPLASVVRFLIIPASDMRPVIYLAVPDGAQLLGHIARNPRISLEMHYAVGFALRHKARGAQFKALATFVEAEGEAASLRQSFIAKQSGPAGPWDADKCQIIRADALSVVYYHPAGRPSWGYLDYLA